jgi:hypothetical protein
MNCLKLMQGLDLSCFRLINKYYQNIVLVNKSDVQSFNIKTSNTQHNIQFSLYAGKYGFLFAAPEEASNLTASFQKKEESGSPVYDHSCSIPVAGVGEDIMILLKQLDQSNLFAAIQYKDNTVEIFGWEYGLETADYDYQPQGGIGGAIIQLKSRYPEYDPPFVYESKEYKNTIPSTPVIDFDKKFLGIPDVNTGDFNDDFNDDFNIEQ